MHRTIFLVAFACFVSLSAFAQGSSVLARVISCYDGDTCTLDRDILPGRNRVHVRGADAPEIPARCAAEERLAQAAKEFTSSRLVGRNVLLIDVREGKSPQGVDAYVRMPDGRDLGWALISAGLARRYDGGKRQSWCADQWR